MPHFLKALWLVVVKSDKIGNIKVIILCRGIIVEEKVPGSFQQLNDFYYCVN